MKIIKLLTLAGMISVLCTIQVKAQSPDIATKIPNQLDSLIRESIIMRHGGGFSKGNNKPYFVMKEGIPAGFNFDSMMREFNIRFVRLERTGLWGDDLKPNGKIKYKNFSRYFKDKRNRHYALQINNIIIDNTYIYVYIKLNIMYKDCFAWHIGGLPSVSFMRFDYKYSPKEKKWNLIGIIDSSNKQHTLPLKIFLQ